MKKGYSFLLMLGLCFVFLGGANLVGDAPSPEDDLIRLHVLANSDDGEDQVLKYIVKDAIVKEMAPKFSSSKNIAESREILLANLSQVEMIARNTLEKQGSTLGVQAQYGRFFFPTKYYGDFSLPAGKYEAVKVIIGEGKGANWWCVLFPPLCFVAADKGEEVSKIKNGYPVNTPEKFKESQYRVSFKLVSLIKNSFAVIARAFQ
ncbi:MAG: stage II sporulation protein R [Peptococcales bacterium]|jgi:stage II sporulation protein R